MQTADISVRRLELFQTTASTGSVQAAAEESGLSVSTVSHHLRKLEDQLGTSLLDHSRRPMVLTPAGAVFLKYSAEALRLIRKAQAEATGGNLSGTRHLRLGLIEDFDSDIAPELAVSLADAMPGCGFSHHTRASHEILDLLRGRKLDIGLAAQPDTLPAGLREFPLLRDPFVLAVPAGSPHTPEEFLAGSTSLPLLRYSPQQIISARIEAQLRRLKIDLPQRFEIESNQTMMAMVAAGSGWAVTTPLCYIRARRFHGNVTLHPFPGKGFARYLSVFAGEESPEIAVRLVEASLRNLIGLRALQPAHTAMPWLQDTFRLLDGGG